MVAFFLSGVLLKLECYRALYSVGPLLLSIFVNDLPAIVEHANVNTDVTTECWMRITYNMRTNHKNKTTNTHTHTHTLSTKQKHLATLH